MSNEQDRRTFLKTTAVLAGSGLAPAVFARSRSETNRLGNEDTLRIALVGCGGRGTGAAAQAAAQIKSVAFHIDGFKRSKSGAI